MLASASSMPAPLMADTDFAMDDISDLHERIAVLRESGPIVSVNCFGKPSWLVLDYKGTDQVLRDKVVFDVTRYNEEIAGPIIGRTLLAMKDGEHKVSRGLIDPSFTYGAARRTVESVLEPTIHELLDRIEGKDVVDIKHDFCRTFPFTVITKLLGVPVEDEENLIRLASLMMTYPFDPEGAAVAIAEFDSFIEDIIRQRMENPSGDLISQMLFAEIDGQKLDYQAVLVFLRTLYPAGGHSTSLNLANAVYAMLANPGAREMVLGTEKERMMVVEEALRWEPALGLLPRMLTSDTEMHGVKIARDEPFYVSITAANNDPAMFADPRAFDPRRKNRTSLLTFGRHEHICLGRHLAMREIEVALRILLERFPNMALVEDKAPVVSGTFFRSFRDLWVRPNG